ncbi:hypothetical protein HGRIS_003747 [Hohenbuehelia grisea]|uniref:Macro domain-containing protein n=1 Tax=Hohenbuehelia grisea TaxID=104357 RepID=A0ABR3JGE7_9AGAR
MSSTHVLLRDIPKVSELYKQGILKAAATPRFLYNEALLDRVSLWQGDITTLEVDSIVNAANKSLLSGGGVDGAIHDAAGPKLLQECRGLNGCETGHSKITKGYGLPSLHVIHTVGPVYSDSDVETCAAQLAGCYKTSLELAYENSLKHIAFPSVSTGVYHYPIADATHIALNEVRRFCDSDAGKKIERVIFVVWSDRDKGVYESLIPEYFPPSREERGQ